MSNTKSASYIFLEAIESIISEYLDRYDQICVERTGHITNTPHARQRRKESMRVKIRPSIENYLRRSMFSHAYELAIGKSVEETWDCLWKCCSDSKNVDLVVILYEFYLTDATPVSLLPSYSDMDADVSLRVYEIFRPDHVAEITIQSGIFPKHELLRRYDILAVYDAIYSKSVAIGEMDPVKFRTNMNLLGRNLLRLSWKYLGTNPSKHQACMIFMEKIRNIKAMYINQYDEV